MNPTTNRQSIEDKDAACRLRHRLNFHCLAHIFQHLDSKDIVCTLGGMNKFYRQLINDSVIRNHYVILREMCRRDIVDKQVFEKSRARKPFRDHCLRDRDTSIQHSSCDNTSVRS